MRVLGVDPGLTRCGIGVVDGEPGRPLRLVHVDVVRTPADLPVAERLRRIADEIDAQVALHRPDVVAVERVFSQHNVRTVMGTAQAAGIALLVAARHDIPVALHTPSEVKAAVTGSGRADKGQVGAMITRILKLPQRPKPADAADALALAVGHLWRAGPGLAAAAPGPAGRGHSTGQGMTAAQRAWIEAAAASSASATLREPIHSAHLAAARRGRAGRLSQ